MSGLKRNRLAALVLLATCLVWQTPAHAAPADGPARFELVTLGTVGGPLPDPVRSQPANLLSNGSDSYLIDSGDGAADRMVAAGASFASLRGIFLTHHHFDHIGGLFAVLGLRFQLDTPGPLTIYGPRGTRELVAGLLSAMGPSAAVRYGVPGERHVPPARNIEIVELTDNSVVRLGGITVSAVVNSHYSFDPGSPEYSKYQSLSYRFDLPDRSIVFTGDTGPSPAVETLATGADLLVSELIDLPNTLMKLDVFAKTLQPHAKAEWAEHFEKQHLVPEKIGELARRAGVGAVIVSHLAGTREDAILRYVTDIARHYDGPIVIAGDRQRF
jgi:ribonuclease BN (tRNA processing enzyme)